MTNSKSTFFYLLTLVAGFFKKLTIWNPKDLRTDYIPVVYIPKRSKD